MAPPSTTCPACGRPLVGLDRRPVLGQLSNDERIRRCPVHGRPPHNDLDSRLYRSSEYPSAGFDHARRQIALAFLSLLGPIVVGRGLPAWAGGVLGPVLSLTGLALVLRSQHRWGFRDRRPEDGKPPPYPPVAARWVLNHARAAGGLVVGIAAASAAAGARDVRVGAGVLVGLGVALATGWWRNGPVRRAVQWTVPPDPFHDR